MFKMEMEWKKGIMNKQWIKYKEFNNLNLIL